MESGSDLRLSVDHDQAGLDQVYGAADLLQEEGVLEELDSCLVYAEALDEVEEILDLLMKGYEGLLALLDGLEPVFVDFLAFAHGDDSDVAVDVGIELGDMFDVDQPIADVVGEHPAGCVISSVMELVPQAVDPLE